MPTITQRTATSGNLASGAAVAITLPTGASNGDLLVVIIGESGTQSGPAAPTGWTLQGLFTSGGGHSVSVFTAPYSAGLTLTFTNAVGSGGTWICNAYYDGSGVAPTLDGTPLAAHNTTSNTTMPTGAPTTGVVAGDYEVLAYSWNSTTTIATVASGSTIDTTRTNIGSIALGHNNTTSLPASTTVTAFSQTLTAAQTRKTGVGLLLAPLALVTGTAGITLGGLSLSAAGASLYQGAIALDAPSLLITSVGLSIASGSSAMMLPGPTLTGLGNVFVIPATPDPVVLPYTAAWKGSATTPLPPIQSPVITASDELDAPPPGTASNA